MSKQKLEVEISADAKKFARGMAQVKTLAGSVIKAVAILGATGAAGFAAYVAAASKAANALDEINKASDRTGITTDEIQRLQTAAKLSDASLEGLGKATKTMATLLYDAANGSKEANRTIGELGLSQSKLAKMTPAEQLLAFLNAVADVEEPARRAALANKAFGKSGTDLLPMLVEGSKGLAKLRGERERLGPLFTKDQIQAGTDFGDALERLRQGASIIAIQALAVTLPKMAVAFDSLAVSIAKAGNSPEFKSLSEQAGILADSIGDALENSNLLLGSLSAVGKVLERINSWGENEKLGQVLEDLTQGWANVKGWFAPDKPVIGGEGSGATVRAELPEWAKPWVDKAGEMSADLGVRDMSRVRGNLAYIPPNQGGGGGMTSDALLVSVNKLVASQQEQLQLFKQELRH